MAIFLRKQFILKAGCKGAYKGIFFLNLIINFICPLLILMKEIQNETIHW